MTDNRSKQVLLKSHSEGTLYDLWDVELPKIEYYIEGLIPTFQATAFCGASEAGKSTLLIYLGLHIASGKDTFLGKTKRAKVLYIDEEMGVIGFQKKVLQIAKANNISKEDIKDMFEHRCMQSFKLDDDENAGKQTLEYAILNKGVEVIIVDSLLACTKGDVNTIEMRKLRDITTIAYKYGVSIIFNHHTNKIESKKSKLSLTSLFGSSDIGNALDNAFGVIKFKDKIRLQQIKGRYMPPEEQIDINVPFVDMRYGDTIKTSDISNKYIKAIKEFCIKSTKSKWLYSDFKKALVPNKMSEPTMCKYLDKIVTKSEGDYYVI